MAQEILKDMFYVGYKDWEVRNFHGYSTNRGSSYNAYLVKSGSDYRIIDTAIRPYFEYYLIKFVPRPEDLNFMVVVNKFTAKMEGN